MAKGDSTVGIEISGLAKLRGMVKAAAARDHPEWSAGAARATGEFRAIVAARAPGSLSRKTSVRSTKTLLGPTVGVVAVSHPGARSLEFGSGPRAIRAKGKRVLWWRGAAHPVVTVRQDPRRPRPYIGIIHGDHAIAEFKPRLEEILAVSLARVWATAPLDGSD